MAAATLQAKATANAGFLVIMSGRFGVITEDSGSDRAGTALARQHFVARFRRITAYQVN
jgi:hypothetical protein